MQGEGVYFDGLRPVRRTARLALADKALMLSVDGGPWFGWSYGSIRLEPEGGATSRFRREESGTRTGEVLEIAAADFAAALGGRCPSLAGDRAERSRGRMKILAWSLAAVVSLAAMIVYGVPALASRLAVMVPWSTEKTLGDAVEGQVLRELSDGAPKICAAGRDTPGSRALAAMVQRLSAHAVLPGPLDVKVVDSKVENAFAIPGGKIFFMRGLIEKADGPDEVAGVLAHEIGHVVNRDSLRGLIHAGGISFLVGTLLGDFTGAGALVIASRYLLTSRHSREVESQADNFAIEVMGKAGADVRALGGFLRRVASGPAERQLELLLTHPVTEDRVAEIQRRAGPGPFRPILDRQEWLALRGICRD